MKERDIKAKDLINTKEVADILKVSDPHVIYFGRNNEKRGI